MISKEHLAEIEGRAAAATPDWQYAGFSPSGGTTQARLRIGGRLTSWATSEMFFHVTPEDDPLIPGPDEDGHPTPCVDCEPWKSQDGQQRADIQFAAAARQDVPDLCAALREAWLGCEWEHGDPCYYCGEPCSAVAGNPSEWPIPLCHPDEPGRVKSHHIGCVSARLVALDERDRELEEWREALGSQTETLQRALAKMEEHANELHEALAREAMLREALGWVRGSLSVLSCSPHDPQIAVIDAALSDAHDAEPLEAIRRLMMIVDFYCNAEGDDRPVVEEVREAVDDCRRLFGKPRP